MEIKKAIKSQQKLRLGISGASGSGKTYSALLLASSLGSKVCVIDTEQGSASLYADKFEFDVLELTAPYSSERYIEALKRVEMAGYDVIVIDSLSHNWNQAGGCLDKVNQIGGNSYAAWGKVTPQYDKLIHSILACKAHVIGTMRSKTAYELVENEKGKLSPVKRGLAPVQRDGIEYEFTLMFDLDQNHNFICTKDRTGLFNNIDIPEPLNQEIASKLLTWLNSGEAKLNHLNKHFELEEEPSEVFTALKKKIETEAFTLLSLDIFAQEIAANKDYLSANELAELRQIFKETKTKLNKIEQGEITL
jgi:hypothetical protein